MKIDFISEVSNSCGLSAAKLEYLAKDVRSKLSKDAEIVEVMLVSDKRIKELNNKFRGKNTVTDVLSFPQEQFEKSKENITGTIFIAPNYAAKNNSSCEELFVHGLLHLLGFDHEKNASDWQEAENKINKD